MIVEVRTYTIAEGCRQRFVELFETRTRPLQEAHGVEVVGPWLDVEDGRRFVWMRSFSSLEEREERKAALYASAEWTGELEAVMMPMLSDFTSIQVEMSTAQWAGLRHTAPATRPS